MGDWTASALPAPGGLMTSAFYPVGGSPPPSKSRVARSSFELKSDLQDLLDLQATLRPTSNAASTSKESPITQSYSFTPSGKGTDLVEASTDKEKRLRDELKGRSSLASVGSTAKSEWQRRKSSRDGELVSPSPEPSPPPDQSPSPVPSPVPSPAPSPAPVPSPALSEQSPSQPPSPALSPSPSPAPEPAPEPHPPEAPVRALATPNSEATPSNDEHIQVVCRVRPHDDGRLQCLEVSPSDPTLVTLQSSPPVFFKFDYVAGEESTQEELFARVGWPLAQAVVSGYNATCFAYGQVTN